MKKKTIWALVIILGICLAGCGKQTDTRDSRDKERKEKKKEIAETVVVEEDEEPYEEVELNVPEYYAQYADLLHQFMNEGNNYFMDNDNAVSYVQTDGTGVAFSVDFSFGLYDLNKDGTEELLVVSGNEFKEGGTANIIIPRDKWSDANIGEISYIDVNSGKVASRIYDLGDSITYYDFTGNELKEYDSYHFSEYSEGDENLFMHRSYYHGKGDKKEISEDEYNNQEAFYWGAPDIPFYCLSNINIELILNGKIKNDENEVWKQAYIPIVKQWNAVHSYDYSYGYELAYIDDNDTPELILTCDDSAWYAYDIYTCIDGKAVKVRYEGDGSFGSDSDFVSPGCQGKGDAYIEKSGIYMNGWSMMGNYGVRGYVLDGGVLTEAFYYSCYDLSWDETSADPYGYKIEYIDGKGNRISNEAVTDGSEQYYDINGAPESKQIEEVYNCDFDNTSGFMCSLNYKAISTMLGVDNAVLAESDNEKYAKLLYQYMNDNTKGIYEGYEGFPYKDYGGKFILCDVNCDGTDEMLLTAIRLHIVKQRDG